DPNRRRSGTEGSPRARRSCSSRLRRPRRAAGADPRRRSRARVRCRRTRPRARRAARRPGRGEDAPKPPVNAACLTTRRPRRLARCSAESTVATASVRPVSEPATWGVRRTLLDLTDKLHLARPLVRTYELALAARSNLRRGEPEAADGLPLPPARLRAQIGPLHADAAFFLRSGR